MSEAAEAICSRSNPRICETIWGRKKNKYEQLRQQQKKHIFIYHYIYGCEDVSSHMYIWVRISIALESVHHFIKSYPIAHVNNNNIENYIPIYYGACS